MKTKQPLTGAERQAKRRAESDAAAKRDKIMKDGRQATGAEAIRLWNKGIYILVKK